MSFFSWLFRPFFAVFRWFGYSSGPLSLGYLPEGDEIHVIVKTAGGGTKSVAREVDLRPDWSIGEVKRKLVGVLPASGDDLRIVLAGRELDDSITVRDCDLGDSTVIHAISTPTVKPIKDANKVQKLALPEEQAEVPCERKVHFYVYCDRAECQEDMQPGKLRVRCQRCKDGAILVAEDPGSWEDVLTPERVHGFCQNGPCQDEGDDGLGFVEIFFKCAGNRHKSGAGAGDGSCPPLYMVRSNIGKIGCLACMDLTAEIVVVFDCEDHHVVCLDCFKDFCGSRLNSRAFVLDEEVGYTLPCPMECNKSLIKETKHFKILGKDQYERYQRFAAEEFVIRSGGSLCPQPGCGAGNMPDAGEDVNRVICAECKYVYCKLCSQGYHIGECHAQSNVVDDNVAPDSLSSWIAIRVTTKPCPKCQTPTERSGGCMHMTCSKSGCGFDWCWVCQTPWTRDCMASHWFG